MKKVTIQDIANSLGVSRNTVSKAINNTGTLAESTRERVLQKAVEMGYKHFSYIKSQTSGSENHYKHEKAEIALLCEESSAANDVSPMLGKLKKGLLQHGYRLTIHRVKRENMQHRTLPSSFDPGAVSGILCVEMLDRAYDEMICSLGLPVLFVDGPCKRDGIDLPSDQLYMDNMTAVTRFVSDMLAQGKRSIGFIGNYEGSQSLFERYVAFRSAMLMAGAPVEKRFCIRTDSREEMKKALSSLSDFPDVFICSRDPVAVDAIDILSKLGRSVPGDVLVCGFGDSPQSIVMTPSLTTVHIHSTVMAVTAIQLLLSRIDDPDLDYRVVHTQTELIYRVSTRIQRTPFSSGG